MDNRSPSMLKPAMIGGALGILGGLPFLGCGCCLWMAGGGFLASYLYAQECKKAGAPFRLGTGATVGLISAPFYALATSVISGVVSAFTGPPDVAQMEEMFEQMGLPAESMEMAMKFAEGSQGFTGMLIGFFVVLLLAAAFATIGGLIGGAVFKNEPAPAASGGEPPAAAD